MKTYGLATFFVILACLRCYAIPCDEDKDKDSEPELVPDLVQNEASDVLLNDTVPVLEQDEYPEEEQTNFDNDLFPYENEPKPNQPILENVEYSDERETASIYEDYGSNEYEPKYTNPDYVSSDEYEPKPIQPILEDDEYLDERETGSAKQDYVSPDEYEPKPAHPLSKEEAELHLREPESPHQGHDSANNCEEKDTRPEQDEYLKPENVHGYRDDPFLEQEENPGREHAYNHEDHLPPRHREKHIRLPLPKRDKNSGREYSHPVYLPPWSEKKHIRLPLLEQDENSYEHEYSYPYRVPQSHKKPHPNRRREQNILLPSGNKKKHIFLPLVNRDKNYEREQAYLYQNELPPYGHEKKNNRDKYPGREHSHYKQPRPIRQRYPLPRDEDIYPYIIPQYSPLERFDNENSAKQNQDEPPQTPRPPLDPNLIPSLAGGGIR